VPPHATPNDRHKTSTPSTPISKLGAERDPSRAHLHVAERPGRHGARQRHRRRAAREVAALSTPASGASRTSSRAKGLLDRTNIFVRRPHGSRRTRAREARGLVAPFAKPLPDGSPDIVVAEGRGDFRRRPDAARVRAIVACCSSARTSARSSRGRSRARELKGRAGTLSSRRAWNQRAGRDPGIQPTGPTRRTRRVPGRRPTAGRRATARPARTDIHNTLIAPGPISEARVERRADRQRRSRADAAALARVEVPSSMTGRVNRRALEERSGDRFREELNGDEKQ
jgi:hypothetical protein